VPLNEHAAGRILPHRPEAGSLGILGAALTDICRFISTPLTLKYLVTIGILNRKPAANFPSFRSATLQPNPENDSLRVQHYNYDVWNTCPNIRLDRCNTPHSKTLIMPAFHLPTAYNSDSRPENKWFCGRRYVPIQPLNYPHKINTAPQLSNYEFLSLSQNFCFVS
jgi:hypothetical protein